MPELLQYLHRNHCGVLSILVFETNISKRGRDTFRCCGFVLRDRRDDVLSHILDPDRLSFRLRFDRFLDKLNYISTRT